MGRDTEVHIWTSTAGIDLSYDQEKNINCQSTDYSGEYEEWVGCISTSLAAMFRINDGIDSSVLAKYIIKSDDNGANPTGVRDEYSGKCSYETKTNLSRDEALGYIKEQLADGKVCAVKLNNKKPDGHTVVCCGVESGKSLKDATWADLLFNDVERGQQSYREANNMIDMAYQGVTYSVLKDGECKVYIDTSK